MQTSEENGRKFHSPPPAVKVSSPAPAALRDVGVTHGEPPRLWDNVYECGRCRARWWQVPAEFIDGRWRALPVQCPVPSCKTGFPVVWTNYSDALIAARRRSQEES